MIPHDPTTRVYGTIRTTTGHERRAELIRWNGLIRYARKSGGRAKEAVPRVAATFRTDADALALVEADAYAEAAACTCHREQGSHELCCGHPDGRDPNCPQHGDQAAPIGGWAHETPSPIID